MIDGVSAMLTEDGQAAVIGVNVDGSGVSLDASAQFREGSDAASLASVTGNASEMLDHVPDMPFIFAFAMDLSSPALKAWMADMSEMAMAMQPAEANPFGFMNPGELMELVDGSAFVMGNPPSLMMGGIFHSMMEFKASKDPAVLRSASREMVAKMDGMSQGGITFNSTIDADVKEIAGSSVDRWSMKMTPDPEDPAGAQMAMAFSMIFGPNGGPRGYYATADSGLISTMSENDELMARAIEAANEGNGLASGNKLREAISRQPEGSLVQVFVDVGTLGKQVMGMMAMMGGGGPEVDIPDNLPPVGMSLASGGGGLHGRIHVPQGIIDMISSLAEEMAPGAGNEGDGPRF